MVNEKLDTLLKASSGVNGNLDDAINKLMKVIKTDGSEELKGILTSLLNTQLELSGLDKCFVETIDPNNIDYKSVVDEKNNYIKSRQEAILSELNNSNVEEISEENFLKF